MTANHIQSWKSPSSAGVAQDDYVGLAVIIPTRNRADLAIRAIQSVLAERLENVRVVVSDNSTDDADVARLRRFCDRPGNSNVRYIRPASPLAMSPHWEWAFEQVLEQDIANHITVLGDRRIFRKGCLGEITDILRRHPHSMLTYDQTMIRDLNRPVEIWQRPWSGELLEIDAVDMLRANAHGAWLPYVPILQKCVVTRAVLQQVREQFGNWFLSISPDYVFGFRSLEVVQRVLFYDKSVVIGSALDRSNGYSFTRGIDTKDKKDFVATNPELEGGLSTTPIPEIMNCSNVTFNEYGIVRAESRSARFPEIDLPAYLDVLFEEVQNGMENHLLRQRYTKILADHGCEAAKSRLAPATDSSSGILGPRTTEPIGLKQRLKRMMERPSARPILGAIRSFLRSGRRTKAVFSLCLFRLYWTVVRSSSARDVPAWASKIPYSCQTAEDAITYLNFYQEPEDRQGSLKSLRNNAPKGVFEEFPFRPVPK